MPVRPRATRPRGVTAVPTHSLSQVTDAELLRSLAVLVRTDHITAASLLAHLAEVDAREAYAPLGYASIWLYCVGELKLAPDVAAKRIQAARAVRELPALLHAIEDGRLTVTAVVLLAPHVTTANFDELVAAVAGRSLKDIKAILAHYVSEWRPGADPLGLATAGDSTGAPTVTNRSLEQDSNPVAPSNAGESALVMVPLSPTTPAAPPAPVRFPLHTSVTKATRDKLDYARDLLGHAVRRGDVAEVLDRALDALIEKLEKRRFGAGSRSRTARRGRGASGRAIPMAIRHEVFRRDAGHCTFVGDTGHRCESRNRLQFDHVLPLARGGQTTAVNLRLRCQTHNQLEAERTFGAAFMRGKREQARRDAARKREAAAETAEAALRRDVISGLRGLGFSADEARRAAALGEDSPGASIEERFKLALQSLAPPAARRTPPAASAPA